jgi:hypothetical protein
MKRVSPRAMGRAFFIRHKTSHVTIGVSDEVNGAGRATAPARAAQAAAAPAPAGKAPVRGRAKPKEKK